MHSDCIKSNIWQHLFILLVVGLHKMKFTKGIVYIAVGDKFVKEAKISARTVMQHMPDIPITLMTDNDITLPEFDSVIKIDEPRYDFGDQVYHLKKTPYDYTIFFDSDIYLAEPVYDIFNLLNSFDIAATQDQQNYSSERVELNKVETIPDCFPEYNSGVVAFRSNEKVENFFSEWENVYEEVNSRGQIHNQAAFRVALYQSNLRIATLPWEYNCIFRQPGCVNGSVKIFHGRLYDFDSIGANRYADVEQAVAELNQRNDLRAYYTAGSEVRLVEPNLLEQGLYSLKNRGIIKTIKQIYYHLRHQHSKSS